MRRDNREDKLRRCKDELARLQQIRLNHTVIQDKAINGCHSKEQHSFNKILKQIQPNPQLNSWINADYSIAKQEYQEHGVSQQC